MTTSIFIIIQINRQSIQHTQLIIVVIDSCVTIVINLITDFSSLWTYIPIVVITIIRIENHVGWSITGLNKEPRPSISVSISITIKNLTCFTQPK